MPRIDIPFVGSDYANRSSNVQNQRTVNLYPRTQGAGAKAPVTLESTPGLTILGVAGTGPWRSNGAEFQDNLYAVSGNALYKINTALSATSIGTLSTSGGRCELVAGRDYLLIVDGTTGYTYDGTTFATIADADFTQDSAGNAAIPTHCTYLDGYFIVNKGGTDEFAISALEDPTDWATLDFATAEANPDDILAHTATYKDLYLIGSKTTQVYYNSGNPSFPFDPYKGGTMDVGIKAPHSLVRSSVGMFWLATAAEGDVSVIQCVGTQIQVVSEDIAWDLTSMVTTDDATGLIIRKNGRTIYQISFPTEDKTFEYIIEERKWVERKTYGIGRYRAAGAGYIGGQHIVFDYENGNFYKLDYDAYKDNSEIIERIRRAQVIHASHNRMLWHELVIEFEAGTGIVSGQGSDPQAMLRYSDDGGHTWSNELWVSTGKIGEYKRRAVWRRLGQSRQRIYEVKITDPINVHIIAAYAMVTVCSS